MNVIDRKQAMYDVGAGHCAGPAIMLSPGNRLCAG